MSFINLNVFLVLALTGKQKLSSICSWIVFSKILTVFSEVMVSWKKLKVFIKSREIIEIHAK